jgi:hypothetical protein
MADTRSPSLIEFPRDALGVEATVFMDDEQHEPRVWRGGNDLRDIEGDEADGQIVSDLQIVSSYSLHVALFGLQNPTPENIAKALYKLGTGGDLEDWTDSETLLPLPVPEPDGWDRAF